jgi:hypothetical protein
MTKGKSPDEIRKTFDIQNDLTREEERTDWLLRLLPRTSVGACLRM